MYGLTAGATKFHAFFHTLDISYVIFKAAKQFQWLLVYHVECDLMVVQKSFEKVFSLGPFQGI